MPPGPVRDWRSWPGSNAPAALDAAAQHAAEAIEIAVRAKATSNMMSATGHLGRILLARGEPGAAGHLEQAVQLARAFGVRPLPAWWIDSLGELAELEGRHGDARSWYEQAIGHATESGLAADAARARHHLGRLAWLTGDLASAVNICHEALAGQLEAGDCLGLVETLETLGGLLIDEGSARRGLPLLAAASAAREQLGFPVRPVRPAESRAGSHQGASSSARRRRLRGSAVPRSAPGSRRDGAPGAGTASPACVRMAEPDPGRAERRRPRRPGAYQSRDRGPARGKRGHRQGPLSSVLRKLGARTRAEVAAAFSGRSGI